MFRYSGSKARTLKRYPIVCNASTIVEPFAGSAAFSMTHLDKKIILCEADLRINSLWHYLKSVPKDRLHWLMSAKTAEGTDVRNIPGLTDDERILIRLYTCGVYTGTLSCYKIYHHGFNLQKFIDADFSNVTVLSDYTEAAQYDGPDTFMFIDPPYHGTRSNVYDSSLDYRAVEDFILSLQCPYIVTYGEGCREVFPRLDWRLAFVKHVPKIKTGGTIERREYYATGQTKPINKEAFDALMTMWCSNVK